MNKKGTISPELKVDVVEKYLYHEYAFRECLRIADVSDGTFEMWVSKYRAFGPSGLLKTIHSKKYAESIKKSAVEAYVSGLGSQNDICSKYGISTRTSLQRWIKKYNGDNTIISSRIGEKNIMTNGRKTTFNERIDLVKECIENNHNYDEIIEKYKVSYHQIYAWTRKYESNGIDALMDKRGRKTPDDELSDFQRLQAQNTLLKAQNRQQEMEIDFLKKLNEIERR